MCIHSNILRKENNLKKVKKGDLKVWWIPQVPMKPFEVPVKNIDEAILLLKTLALYDIFQFENNIKPDYCNAGGLQIYEDGEWIDYYSEDSQDIDEIMREQLKNERR